MISSLTPGKSQIGEGVCLSEDDGNSFNGTAENSRYGREPDDIVLDADSIAKSQPDPNTEPLDSLNASVSRAADHSTADPLSAAEEGIEHLAKI